jgi:hypothetical protein
MPLRLGHAGSDLGRTREPGGDAGLLAVTCAPRTPAGARLGEALTADYPATDYVRSRYADLVENRARMLERGQDSGQIRRDVDVEDAAAS